MGKLYSPLHLRVEVISHPLGLLLSFIPDFDSWLIVFLSDNTPALVLGDFNIHGDDPPESTASYFLSLIASFDLKSWINFPTHSGGHSLDLVFAQNSSISGLSGTDSPPPSLCYLS